MKLGDPLGGVNDFLSTVVSLPAFLAAVAIVMAALQGVLCLESVDPCRLSVRKMNILLSMEVFETVVLFVSELVSFFAIRSAFQSAFPTAFWVAPCFLAAGLLQIVSEIYFTLAVISKNRIAWIPISASGSSSAFWELIPFSITVGFSVTLIGWRLRFWMKGNIVNEAASITAVQMEEALQSRVLGFAVGWAVAVSGLVLIILLLSDCSESGPGYFASFRYLWKPEEWIEHQHVGTRVWYREVEDHMMESYEAVSILDNSIPIMEQQSVVHKYLERAPLHIGNAIMGDDMYHCYKEDKHARRLKKLVFVAEHVVVLPLLAVVTVIVARLHDKLDVIRFGAIRELVDGVIVLAFIEFAIAIKNWIWGFRGVSKSERTVSSSNQRVSAIQNMRQAATKSHANAAKEVQAAIKIE